jgi:thioredoxin reductase (NADPH)
MAEITWLPAEVACDEEGFVLTDVAAPPGPATARTRLPYETGVDGMFAAGDIRAGSMKRVAAAGPRSSQDGSDAGQ